MQHHNTMGSPPQQFCLRWNNYQSNLTNVFDQLLQSEAFVDVTLACDGHSVKAHKMVLSACSPYFQTLFFENPCRHPIVILKDIKWPELKAVVEFMYRGEINVLQEQIGPLLKVAETLKIRGLADVNNEMDSPLPPSHSSSSQNDAVMTPTKCNNKGGGHQHVDPRNNVAIDARYWRDHEEDPIALKVPTSSHRKKRRRASGGERSTCSSASSPEEAASAAAAGAAAHMELLESVAAAGGLMEPAVAAAVAAAAAAAAGLSPPSGNNDHCRQHPGTPDLPLPPPSLPLPPPPPPSNDDMEIKPGIAEMILEEERAKLLESSHAWLGASTSSITADSYQYQLQSMWQKCWNTNQSLVHNLRFRERGPLKSWRPETMAEAIFSVLKEGLSLSQAARKYDIPYPTFVLYANRVHNMLGPSADGGADLRPKGRGRPQRILLGVWPEEHIRGVIRAVVFRDPQHIKEEAQSLARLYCLQDPLSQSPQGYSSNGPCNDGGSRSETPTPGSAAAAAVAAVAQGLRQQMCGLAAGGEGGSQQGPSAAAAAAALANAILGREAAESMHSAASLNNNTLNAMMNNGTGRMGGLGLGNIGVSGMTYKPGMFAPPRPENLFQEDIEDIVKSPLDHVDSMDESDSIQQVKPEPALETSAD